MSEMTEETLQKIVEERWGEARSQLVPIPLAGYLAQVCTKGHEHFVKVGAPTAEKAAGMAAAAVLAPELLALVEAARKWEKAEAEFMKPSGPIGSRDEQQQVSLRWRDAKENLRTTLARLPEEVGT